MKKDHVTKQRVAEKREKDTEFLFFDKVEDEETIGQRMEERERERGKGESSPMVLPYGKSPAGMVNARIIGGRCTDYYGKPKSNDELF